MRAFLLLQYTLFWLGCICSGPGRVRTLARCGHLQHCIKNKVARNRSVWVSLRHNYEQSCLLLLLKNWVVKESQYARRLKDCLRSTGLSWPVADWKIAIETKVVKNVSKNSAYRSKFIFQKLQHTSPLWVWIQNKLLGFENATVLMYFWMIRGCDVIAT